MNSPLPHATRRLASVFDNTTDPGTAQGPGSYFGACLPEPPDGGSIEPSGSRRRKLWELRQGALCPLMGVCLPIATHAARGLQNIGECARGCARQ